MAEIAVNALDITQEPLARVYFAVNATETDSASNSEIITAGGAYALYVEGFIA